MLICGISWNISGICEFQLESCTVLKLLRPGNFPFLCQYSHWLPYAIKRTLLWPSRPQKSSLFLINIICIAATIRKLLERSPVRLRRSSPRPIAATIASCIQYISVKRRPNLGSSASLRQMWSQSTPWLLFSDALFWPIGLLHYFDFVGPMNLLDDKSYELTISTCRDVVASLLYVLRRLGLAFSQSLPYSLTTTDNTLNVVYASVIFVDPGEKVYRPIRKLTLFYHHSCCLPWAYLTYWKYVTYLT